MPEILYLQIQDILVAQNSIENGISNAECHKQLKALGFKCDLRQQTYSIMVVRLTDSQIFDFEGC